MSKRDFAEDRRICDAATAGPWRWVPGNPLYRDYGTIRSESEGDVCDFGNYTQYYPIAGNEPYDIDIDFIIEARTGWPAALDEITKLETELIVKESEYQAALDKVIRAERWAKEAFERESQLRDDIAELETQAADDANMVFEILADHECSISTREIIEKYYEVDEEGGAVDE